MTPQHALWLSVAAATATIALKWSAWWITGSVGFLSDALDSVVNLAAAGFALWAVSFARRPADAAHPYGYGKAEYFSSAVEGLLILLAAVGVVTVAVERLLSPQPMQPPGMGAALAAAAAAMNFAVARVLVRTGRTHRSLATVADGQHLMADVWMTGGVIVGVGLAWLTGWMWLDPAVALVVAANLLRESLRLLAYSVRGLMDAAWPDDDIRRAQEGLSRLATEGASFCNLRTRRSGARRFAFIELRVPPEWSVARADRLVRQAEDAAAREGVSLVVRVVPAGAERRA